MKKVYTMIKQAKMHEQYAKALRCYVAGLREEGNKAWAKAKMLEYYASGGLRPI